jgi:hypothetical protein
MALFGAMISRFGVADRSLERYTDADQIRRKGLGEQGWNGPRSKGTRTRMRIATEEKAHGRQVRFCVT